MPSLLGTDDNFEIPASTIKPIYDQTCRTCGVTNRMIIFMPNKDDTRVRKLKFDHKLGDTLARQHYERA